MKTAPSENAAAAGPRAWTLAGAGTRTTGTFLALALLAGLTKAVGFLREIVLAAAFGASRQMDAFLVAQTLPAAVQRVFEELLGATALPMFVGWVVSLGEPVARARLKRLLMGLLAVCGAFVGVVMLLARPVINILAPGLAGAGTSVAVCALQIMLPSIGLVVIGTIFTALLNYYRRFLRAAAIALAGNVVALLCLVLLAGRLGVYSAAWGMTASTLLVAGLQWRALPAVDDCAPEGLQARLWLPEFARLAKPLGMAIALFNLIPLIERFLASWLPEGSIALINYAFKVDWLVYMVFVMPITTMVFPRLAAAAEGNRERFQHSLEVALKGALLVLLPAMVMLLISGEPLVRLLFQRGSFSAEDTVETAAILKVYAFGLPGAATTLILFYALYALKEPAGRVAAAVLGLGVALGWGWVLVRLWGARGIALTHAINFSLMAILLGWLLRRALGFAWWGLFGSFAIRAVLAGAATLLVVWPVPGVSERVWSGASVATQASRIAVCGLATSGVFVSLCWLLRIQEVRSLASELRGYLVALANSGAGLFR